MRFFVVFAAACSVPVTHFTPTGGGDDGGGSGTPAMLSVSPNGDVPLGTVVIGQTSSPSTISVSNSGDMDSGPIAINLDDTSLGFMVASGDTCTGQPLAGHSTCSFALQFAPVTAASVQTNVHVQASPGGDITKLVLGTGLVQGAVDITEASFDYTTQGLGLARTHVFTVRNTGQAQIGVPMASTSSGDPAYRVMSTTCSTPLNQTDTCTVTVAFGPTSVGSKAGSLVVTSTPGGQDAASLAGVGSAHVTVQRAGAGGGTVTSNPMGISCGSMCAADFTVTPVTLSAAPDGTSNFAGWGTDCTGMGACTLDLTANKSVVANFAVNKYPLTVSFSSGNPGANKITSNPPGINCDGTNGCTGMFTYNSTVTLTAMPDPNTGRFDGWSAGTTCATQGNPCTITMPAQPISESGAFNWWGTMTIVMNKGDAGFPTVTTQVNSMDGQISCSNTTLLSGSIVGHYGPNAMVKLTYSGNPSSGWTNCQGGTNPKFLQASALGACRPPSGVICGGVMGCPGFESCTYTFSTPGDVTSEYDVACEM